jgi:hypothetical protein
MFRVPDVSFSEGSCDSDPDYVPSVSSDESSSSDASGLPFTPQISVQVAMLDHV